MLATRTLLIGAMLLGCSSIAAQQAKKPHSSTAKRNVTRGPSLEETVEWIKQALSSYGSTSAYTTGSNGWVAQEIDTTQLKNSTGCTVVFLQTWESTTNFSSGPPRTAKSRWSVTIDLRQVDPSSVKVSAMKGESSPNAQSTASGFKIALQTTNLAKSVTVSATEYEDSTGTSRTTAARQTSGVALDVSDSHIADRLVTALTHAVELCGGQKSAF